MFLVDDRAVTSLRNMDTWMLEPPVRIIPFSSDERSLFQRLRWYRLSAVPQRRDNHETSWLPWSRPSDRLTFHVGLQRSWTICHEQAMDRSACLLHLGYGFLFLLVCRELCCLSLRVNFFDRCHRFQHTNKFLYKYMHSKHRSLVFVLICSLADVWN